MKSPAAWLDYSGQSTRELLACVDSFDPYSVLAAFETALEFKAEQKGMRSLSAEERVLLSVMALEREVNNGGFEQFFCNPSRRYAGTIVTSLRRAGCHRTVDIAARAIDSLDLERVTVRGVRDRVLGRSRRRERILRECGDAFYSDSRCEQEIETELVAFVRAHASSFRLLKGYRPPTGEDKGSCTAISDIFVEMEGRCESLSLAGLRKEARNVARELGLSATQAEIDGAAALYRFAALAADDPAGAERHAGKAFELVRQEPVCAAEFCCWIESLIEAGQAPTADRWMRKYLDWIPESGESGQELSDSLEFWAEACRTHPGKLPRSESHFASHFPKICIAPPKPNRRSNHRRA